jgi:hypothetical protein
MSHKQPQRIIKHSDSFLRRSTQKGSALVIAIFIIIVLSALGAALVNMLDSSQEGVAYEVLVVYSGNYPKLFLWGVMQYLVRIKQI